MDSCKTRPQHYFEEVYINVEKKVFPQRRVDFFATVFLLSTVLLANPGIVQAANAYFHEQRIFTNGTDGYHTYRIPAMIKAGNGDLIAFGEGRVDSSADYGNVDIVMKRSTDNGATWSAMQVVADNGIYQAGNPSPVVDTMDSVHPNRIWLVYNIAKHHANTVKDGTGVREVMVKYSDDHGGTWSGAANITTSVHKPNETTGGYNYTFAEDWRWYAVTPGHSIQLKTGPYAGRLLFVANHSVPDGSWYSHSFYSDDHGQSWTLGGTVAQSGTNECEAVELANGHVKINMRNQATGQKVRSESISTDGGNTWGAVTYNSDLPEPVCQASILRYTTTGDYGTNRILFSNPVNTSTRTMLTVKLSYDEGVTYTKSRLINAVGAYSDLVIQGDANIGLLYERDGLYYVRFNLEWLTFGTDSLSGGPAAAIHTEPFNSLAGWTTSGSGTKQISPSNQLHIKDTLNVLTNIYRSDKSIPGTYTIEFTAKMNTYSGIEDLGLKVCDGAKRLMFKRSADGMYALTDSGSWVKVKSASAVYDWVDYRIAVNNGATTLYSKLSSASTWNTDATWNLANRTDADRIEFWARGTVASPIDYNIDHVRIYSGSTMVLEEEFDDLSGWSNSGNGLKEIAPTAQLNLKDNTGTVTKAYRADKAISQAYLLETKVRIDDFTSADSSFGTKVCNGNYRLMLRIENDGIWVIDATNAWVRKKAMTMNTDWHTYKVMVNNGSAEVFMDDISQFTYSMQASDLTDMIEHWTKASSADPSEVHIEYTNIYDLEN